MVDGASLAAASAAAIALAKELSPTRGDKGGMAWSLDCDGDSRREITGLVGDSLLLFIFSFWVVSVCAKTMPKTFGGS